MKVLQNIPNRSVFEYEGIRYLMISPNQGGTREAIRLADGKVVTFGPGTRVCFLADQHDLPADLDDVTDQVPKDLSDYSVPYLLEELRSRGVNVQIQPSF